MIHDVGESYVERYRYWGKQFDKRVADGEDVSRYEQMAPEHDEQHPYIKEELINALDANVCRSYRALSNVRRLSLFNCALYSLKLRYPSTPFFLIKHIDGWCSPATIEAWRKSHESFEVYSKNIKPGLTLQNRVKQVEFSQRVFNRWGLPVGTKVLWVMSDEKW